MTTIAWDGEQLAADKQSTLQNLKRMTTKIHRVGDELFAMVGSGSHCFAIFEWLKSDRDPAKWPKGTDEDSSGDIIQFTKAGVFVWVGYGFPTPQPIEGKFMAFGCGRDFAMAAMHLGRSAREAIEIASLYDINTGMGIDVLELDN